MTCEECDKAHDEDSYAPYRIGNKEIGWGIIVMKGCHAHLKLTFDILNAAIIKDFEKE